jgi:hypothetical protein
MVGWKVSGSLTYSSVGATLRDYTAVIPVDTTAAATDYEQVIGFYQILSRSPEDRAVLMLEAVLQRGSSPRREAGRVRADHIHYRLLNGKAGEPSK